MDETEEELAQIREEASRIDPYRYRKRFRFLTAIAVGAAGAGLVALVLRMVDDRRNPCERVRDYLCGQDAHGAECTMYQGIVEESVRDESATMRQTIRGQCESRLKHFQEDGVKVP